MSCGWLKNLEVLAERPCAAHSIGSRNLSPLKTGSAPRETEGTQQGPGDWPGWRESDTSGATSHRASEQSACQGGEAPAKQPAAAEQSARQGSEAPPNNLRRPSDRLIRVVRR